MEATKEWVKNKIKSIEYLISDENKDSPSSLYNDEMERFMELLIHIGIIAVPEKTFIRFERQVIKESKFILTKDDLKKEVYKKIFFVFIKNAKSKKTDIRRLIQNKLNFNIMENNNTLHYRMFRDFFSIFDEENKEVAKIFLEHFKYKAVYYFDGGGETEEKEFDDFSSAYSFIKETYKKQLKNE